MCKWTVGNKPCDIRVQECRESSDHVIDGGAFTLEERQIHCQNASGLIEEVELEKQSQAQRVTSGQLRQYKYIEGVATGRGKELGLVQGMWHIQWS